jgi:hypothetical protein
MVRRTPTFRPGRIDDRVFSGILAFLAYFSRATSEDRKLAIGGWGDLEQRGSAAPLVGAVDGGTPAVGGTSEGECEAGRVIDLEETGAAATRR